MHLPLLEQSEDKIKEKEYAKNWNYPDDIITKMLINELSVAPTNPSENISRLLIGNLTGVMMLLTQNLNSIQTMDFLDFSFVFNATKIAPILSR